MKMNTRETARYNRFISFIYFFQISLGQLIMLDYRINLSRHTSTFVNYLHATEFYLPIFQHKGVY